MTHALVQHYWDKTADEFSFLTYHFEVNVECVNTAIISVTIGFSMSLAFTMKVFHQAVENECWLVIQIGWQTGTISTCLCLYH